MKIYVVTSGCYSDYEIEGVFTDEVMANAYANLDSTRQVETYDADTLKVETSPLYARILYNVSNNTIHSICTRRIPCYMKHHGPPKDSYIDNSAYFEFYCIISERAKKDIEKYGKQSPIILKAAQDRWARYRGEHIEDLESDPKEQQKVVGPKEGAKLFRIIVASSGNKVVKEDTRK